MALKVKKQFKIEICKKFGFIMSISYELSLELQKIGTQCPVTPKIKIQATLGLFGMVYAVFGLYTICRNVFYNRIE